MRSLFERSRSAGYECIGDVSTVHCVTPGCKNASRDGEFVGDTCSACLDAKGRHRERYREKDPRACGLNYFPCKRCGRARCGYHLGPCDHCDYTGT